MASAIPNQSRAVDPFASFNSNTVNKLTEMVTRGDDGLTDYNAIQVSADSTSPYTQSVVSIGSIYKDDVMISLTSPHTVDFEDSDHYISFGSGFNEEGYYYIVLDYTYAKSRPAPQASVKILKPSELPNPSVGSTYFFLKAVSVHFTGGSFKIDGYYDYDPDNTDVRRLYTPLYFGVETGLPTFLSQRDRGRLVYESETDKFWFGLADRWVESGTGAGVTVSGIDIDSTSVWAGCIAYVDSERTAQPAIANSVTTKAEIGLTDADATIVGSLSSVRVESGISVAVGDPLYLSATEAGKVTTVKPGVLIQDVGRALTAGDDTTPIEMIFIPRAMLSTCIKGTIETTDWLSWGGQYRADIDITELDSTGYVVVTSFFTDETSAGVVSQVFPSAVHLVDSFGTGLYDTARVYMPTNTEAIHYNISSGTGTGGGTGGGGSGTTNHSLLSNLSYASSGHTGFAQDPHDNTMHSATYITSLDVTYANLSGNGDVGDTAGTVAIGDHTHTITDTHNYNDIPTGEIILFEKDTAVTGYSVLTGVDDGLVYITKGFAAGGETGGTTKSGSTWTQPNHTHGIDLVGNHDHAGPNHRHTGPNHRHTTGSHTLTTSEMPSHTHNLRVYLRNIDGSTSEGDGSVSLSWGYDSGYISSTGGNSSHNHGNTGYSGTGNTGYSGTGNTSLNGSHDHNGATQGDATANTWRPTGRNFTRQQRL